MAVEAAAKARLVRRPCGSSSGVESLSVMPGIYGREIYPSVIWITLGAG